MKKFLGTISAVIIVTLLFAGCAGNNGANNQNGSNAGNQSEPWKDAEGGQIAVGIATDNSGGTEVEYIHVSGHPDPAVEKELNEELYVFSTWDTVFTMGDDNGDVDNIKLNFAVVGNLLSVRCSGTRNTEDSAYPTNFLRTQIFDLTTGKQAGSLSEFIKVGEELRNLIKSGAFTILYPPERDDGNERLAAEIADTYAFYLTETSLGLFIDVLHAEGDYWVFEATYEAIRPVVQTKLALELLHIYEN